MPADRPPEHSNPHRSQIIDVDTDVLHVLCYATWNCTGNFQIPVSAADGFDMNVAIICAVEGA